MNEASATIKSPQLPLRVAAKVGGWTEGSMDQDPHPQHLEVGQEEAWRAGISPDPGVNRAQVLRSVPPQNRHGTRRSLLLLWRQRRCRAHALPV
jgi:hypothetical protein